MIEQVRQLGGGYIDSVPDPQPTAKAVLQVAHTGSAAARLIVIAGPPGVGKTTLAASLLTLLPHSMWIDKDFTAGGFVLAAAADHGLAADQAYGTNHYWQTLRPQEYAGPVAVACANLVGCRQVLLVGGWGPELSLPHLWTGLQKKIAPAKLIVIHLDPPPLESWRQRMRGRCSHCDLPFLEKLVVVVKRTSIWSGSQRLNTDRSAQAVSEACLDLLA